MAGLLAPLCASKSTLPSLALPTKYPPPMTSAIFQPFDLGDTRLSNRIVMAPMTRARNPEYVANALTATYYGQRASAGLIVSEGTPVSQQGQGYIDVPGIWSQEQVAGWKVVTDAVHARQGNIFAQLWHVGRMSHTSLQPNGADPVSASTRPVASSSKSFAFIYREDGTRGTAEPSPARALETEEVPGIVRDFEQAAQRAIDAGFDGIEIHAANGYLFEQFLNPITNDRVDAYGGSLQNRARLILETVDAVAARIGSRKVGIRLAPNNRQFDMPAYAESEASYLYLAEELAKRGLAYVHLNDNHADGSPDMSETFLAAFKRSYGGTVILAGKLTLEWATRLIDQGVIDLAAFGQPFIANPDLVARLQTGVPLATPDRDTYYGGGAEGYIDYPAAT
ncbi:2,4-dienoyl-CoA reductase-like NADH-dependent reductase (Old Yellow Enzyme family) [Xanthomonas campestris]|nr:2,4-dienoyl-CoA reductase-like NADH-dependent reductase (Old Yellow Enzyme family) [Xanthomonas euroxanthea]